MQVSDQNPEGRYEALQKYGRDLTELAETGRLDPVPAGRRKYTARW